MRNLAVILILSACLVACHSDSKCVAPEVGEGFLNAVSSGPVQADSNLDKAIDGCTDDRHEWNAANGSSIVLDAGAVHEMQGVYLWSTGSRMEWYGIESSIDGQTWSDEFYAAPVQSVSGPVYYSLSKPASTRYIRLTSIGEDSDNPNHLGEIRWSITGENITTERVLRDTEATHYQGVSLGSHVLLGATSIHARYVSVIRSECDYGLAPVFIDATGSTEPFLITQTIQGRFIYTLNWDSYPRLEQTSSLFEGPLEPFYEYQDYIFEHPDYDPDVHITGCGLSGRADQYYGFTTMIQDALSGDVPIDAAQWQ